MRPGAVPPSFDWTLVLILWMAITVFLYLVCRIPGDKWGNRWTPTGIAYFVNRAAVINLLIVKLLCLACAFNWLFIQ